MSAEIKSEGVSSHQQFLHAIEEKVGLPLEEICDMAPEDYRKLIEKRHGGKPMKIVPTLLDSDLLTHEQIEKGVDEVLGHV